MEKQKTQCAILSTNWKDTVWWSLSTSSCSVQLTRKVKREEEEWGSNRRLNIKVEIIVEIILTQVPVEENQTTLFWSAFLPQGY